MDGMGYVEFQLSKTSCGIWGCCMNYTGAWRSLVCFQDISPRKFVGRGNQPNLWEDHRQYANATDVNSKTTLPKTNTSHLKMDAFLQTIRFLLRKAYLFRCFCSLSVSGRGYFPTKLYKTPVNLQVMRSSPTTQKKHTTPRSSGFLLQCIGASKKDGFPVEVGWGGGNLSPTRWVEIVPTIISYIEWGYNSKKTL